MDQANYDKHKSDLMKPVETKIRFLINIIHLLYFGGSFILPLNNSVFTHSVVIDCHAIE
jgi:hypothetical protein